MEQAHDAWQTEADGTLAAESEEVRLVVPVPRAGSRQVHFLVLCREAGLQVLLGSGTQENLRDAMDAAMRMAQRFRLRPFGSGA